MKRLTLLLDAVLAISLSLAACGCGDATETVSTTIPPPPPTEESVAVEPSPTPEPKPLAIYFDGLEEQELTYPELPASYEIPDKAIDYTVYLKAEAFEPSPLDDVVEELWYAIDKAAESGHERALALIQFWDVPEEGMHGWLREGGINLLAYVPNYAWLANVQPFGELEYDLRERIRAVVPVVDGDWLLAPEIRDDGIADYALDEQGNAILWITAFSDVATEAIRTLLEALDPVAIDGPYPPDTWIFITSDWATAVDWLKDSGYVLWIDQASPPPEPANDGARTAANVDPLLAVPWGLSGNGIHVGIWEAGNAAAGPGKVDANHPDLVGRVTAVDFSTMSDHATHVAGTIGGTGAASAGAGGLPLQWIGVAPASALFSWDTAGWIPAKIAAGIPAQGLDLANHSYQYGPPFGVYNAQSAGLDMILSLGPRRPQIYAAGNYEGRFPGIPNVSSGGASAKNTITVGATHSDNLAIADFSSRLGTADSRTKPDIVAPGAESDIVLPNDRGIVSTIPLDLNEDEMNNANPLCDRPGNGLDDYTGPYNNPAAVVPGDCPEGCYEGTSMAAAVTSGVVTLLTEAYTWGPLFGPRALPSTYKALLAGTAVDLVANPVVPLLPLTGPDFVYGYGQIDAVAAATALDVAQRGIAPVVQQGGVANGGMAVHALIVPPGVDLRVILVWDDFPGAPLAARALVNDLDLVLFDPAGVPFLQWSPPLPRALGPATAKLDSLNPIEQVMIPGAFNPGGLWRVVVMGSVVPFGPQDYSLVFFW